MFDSIFKGSWSSSKLDSRALDANPEPEPAVVRTPYSIGLLEVIDPLAFKLLESGCGNCLEDIFTELIQLEPKFGTHV